MNYQLTRHLNVRPDDFDRGKTLLENLYHQTRMLAEPEVWGVLEQYRQPKSLGDSPLESRAANLKILVPCEGAVGTNPLVRRFETVSAKVLKYRKVEASSNLGERVAQLREVCRPMAMSAPQDYAIWHDPRRIFEIMLDHFLVFLETEVGQPEAVDLSAEFAKMSLGRPERKEALEQQVSSLHTSWLRATRVAENFPPDARILVLGDDDLVSLALTHFPVKSVQVLEYDSQLVRHLKSQGSEKLRIRRCDLSRGLPEEHQGQYDVVLADPMYAEEGMGFFLACGSAALDPEVESRFYLSTYPPLLEKPKFFPNQVGMCGLTVHQTLEHYNRYPFPEDMREGALEGLLAQGYHPALSRVLVDVPYLYAHLFECGATKW